MNIQSLQAIFYVGDRLWVFTSTVEGSRVLVDVFDRAGVYVDRFYINCPAGVIPLKIKRWIKAIDGDFLYTVEKDTDENMFLKKYRWKTVDAR